MRHAMEALRNTVAVMLAALLYQQTCLAQVDPWERVKLIEDGKKVQVKLHSGKTVNGKMEGWSTEGLSVRQGKDKVVPVVKPDVAQVAMVTGKSRGSKAGYTALITTGVFGGLIGIGCAAGGCSGEGAEGAVFALAGIPFIAGIAAGIAALFPPHKEVIYWVEESTGEAPPAGYTVQVLGTTPAVKSGQTVEVRVQLLSAGGRSVASSRIKLRAIDLIPGEGSLALPVRASREGNPGNFFRYDPEVGTTGGYAFALSTKGLAAGGYKLNFRVGSDPAIWTRSFQVK